MTSNKFSIQPNVNQSSHQIESDNLKKDFEQNYNSSPLNPPYQIDQSDLKDNIIKEKLNDASLDSSQLCNENNNFKEGLEQNLQKNSNLLGIFIWNLKENFLTVF